VNADEEAAEQDLDLRRSFLSEIFHSLSQPLTALHCSLELALRRDHTLDELRASVQSALEDAERLRQRLLLLRALSDASDPGDLSQPLELTELLRELQEEMLPLFESAGKRLELESDGGPILVRGNRARLMRALFCFLEYLFRYSPEGAVFSIRACCGQGRQAKIQIEAASCLPLAPSGDGAAYSCEIEMARRSFRAAGGEFASLSAAAEHSIWEATLLGA
jgi:signal transduction histidine kinase